jgi:hypothetical protein
MAGQCFWLNLLIMATTAELFQHKGARDLTGPPSGRERRRMREARTKFWRVTLVSAFFAIVLGSNLLIGAVVMIKAIRTSSSTSDIAASKRIGRITFPMLDGVFCRHILLDNKTAQTMEEKISRCDEREQAVSRSRSRSSFSWGGH